MPLMYLAKMNLNSKIFEVYDQKLSIDTVLEDVYNKLDTNKIYSERKEVSFVDSLGNKKKYLKISKYQFNDLQKTSEDKIIKGKLVRSFKRPSEELNKETNELKDVYIDESVSIHFYFDVGKELIAFSVRQNFGYNQFTNAFNNLLNMTVDSYGFEVFLQKDEDMLSEKLKSFKRISRVIATLIPPNSNEEELADLRSSLSYISDCSEANARKYKFELLDSDQEPGLNMESKIMKDTIKAVGKGYGDLTTYGTNHNGREQIMKSNHDAALTCIVNENLAEDEYNEEAKSFIARFIANKIAKFQK